ncbi:hypothetical protein BDW66DRAFT_142442 [Aspergillus desertorum]
MPNCSSKLSPPTSNTDFKSVPLPSSLTTFSVCSANSRDGDRIKPRAPNFVLCDFNFSIIGITNAAVFPDPVRAIPTTSWSSMMTGIVLRWIGVGTENPFRVMALSRLAFNPMAWKPPPFFTVRPFRFALLRFADVCFSAMNASSSSSELPAFASPRKSRLRFCTAGAFFRFIGFCASTSESLSF